MNDFYVLIHLELNQILCPIMEIPKTWCNINGLDLLSYDEIYDLEWAGHKDLGWRKLSDIPDDAVGTGDWLQLSKNSLKEHVPEELKGRIDQAQTKDELISIVIG
jgi:hypothetical protein